MNIHVEEIGSQNVEWINAT